MGGGGGALVRGCGALRGARGGSTEGRGGDGGGGARLGGGAGGSRRLGYWEGIRLKTGGGGANNRAGAPSNRTKLRRLDSIQGEWVGVGSEGRRRVRTVANHH